MAAVWTTEEEKPKLQGLGRTFKRLAQKFAVIAGPSQEFLIIKSLLDAHIT
jgi:hypothetical protein